MTSPPTARRRPTLPSVRWWHKWIGIAIGVLLFTWTASGIIMMVPPSSVARAGPGTGAAIDWLTVTVSPARATEVASAGMGGTARRVDLQRLRDGMVYAVRFDGGRTVLVDASRGETVRITADLASVIAKDGLPEAVVRRVDRIDRAPAGYWGRLPAFRVEFDDPRHTVAYVAEATGEVSKTAWRDRVQAQLGHSVHVFTPLKDLPGRDQTRVGTLVITSLIALVSILTGYWLALPRRWRGGA